MMHQNDTLLISQILDGDISGYAVLVDRYKDLAFTIAFRILGRREDSEEVVQDSFVKAFRNLSSFRQKAKFSTWLYRIVYNTAISKKRIKAPGFRSIEDIPFVYSQADPSDEDPVIEKGKMLELAMQQLSEEDRTLLTLFYLDDSSVDDIHTITGLSKSNVKTKLFRARKKLQDMLTKPEIVYG